MFSGRPSDLHPLALADEAQEMLELLGGRDREVEQVRTVVTSGKYQLGLKLTDLLADSDHAGVRGLDNELQARIIL